MRVVIAYVPVLHEGYRKFFEQHKNAQALYILGPEVTTAHRALVKDVRALDPALMKRAIESLNFFSTVEVADVKILKDLATSGADIIMPQEDVGEAVAEEFFHNKKVIFDSVFLRWDRRKTLEGKDTFPNRTVTREVFARDMMQQLGEMAQRSSDFWRQVGAAIVRDGEIIATAYNRHVPSELMPYQDGDPRGNFSQGEHLELSTAIHAEAALIANAAKQGISLQGVDIYVTTFPCPPCAKLIAYSGTKRLFVSEKGYAVLDGESVLKSQGVEIIFVE